MDPQPAAQRLGAVRERVLAQLREAIVTGRLDPGERLVERELAERYGVSRVPVREALRALATEGFVVALSPRRVVVRRLTRTDVDELFELREALEVFAAGLAARRGTPEAIAELRGILDRAARATENLDAEEIAELNTRFHDRILAMAGNGLLATALEPVEGRLRWLTRQNAEWPKLLAEHRRLLEAIASGDPERARACALGHVRDNHLVTLRQLFGADGVPPEADAR